MPLDVSWPDQQTEQYISGLSLWAGERVSIRKLIGGLCNKNFVVEAAGKKYVARVGADIWVHGIVQTSVQNSFTAASELKVAPQVRYHEISLIVADFIEGRCLKFADMSSDAVVAGLVDKLKKLHGGSQSIRGSLGFFWPFQVVRHYAKFITEKSPALAADVRECARIATLLEKEVRPFIPVLTHNDLAPQNAMLAESGEVFLVDWDYGGYGHPMFDIVSIGANADASEERQRYIASLYFGKLTPEIEHLYMVFRLILNLREWLWGAVQEVASVLDSDTIKASMQEIYPDLEQGYSGYTKLNRERFEQAWKMYRANVPGA
jgi:thiamine kinase-like enzyme